MSDTLRADIAGWPVASQTRTPPGTGSIVPPASPKDDHAPSPAPNKVGIQTMSPRHGSDHDATPESTNPATNARSLVPGHVATPLASEEEGKNVLVSGFQGEDVRPRRSPEYET